MIVARMLRAFAREQRVSRRRRILLVMDQAGWRLAAEVEPPEGVGLVFLPACSPERLWSPRDEPLAKGAPGASRS